GEGRFERLRHAGRSFAVFPDEQGMYVVRGVLPPEIGAVLMRAVDGACDALYREVRGAAKGDEQDEGQVGDLLEDDDAESRREARSEEHTSELQSRENLVCRL